MERITVKSSALVSIGYEPATSTFEAEFHGKGDEPGYIWQYRPVDAAVYGSMLLPGASVGTIFQREIKSNPAVLATLIEQEAAA